MNFHEVSMNLQPDEMENWKAGFRLQACGHLRNLKNKYNIYKTRTDFGSLVVHIHAQCSQKWERKDLIFYESFITARFVCIYVCLFISPNMVKESLRSSTPFLTFWFRVTSVNTSKQRLSLSYLLHSVIQFLLPPYYHRRSIKLPF